MTEVENPIPEAIGLGTIVGTAVAAGVLSLAFATVLGISDARRERWVRWGTVGGLLIGSAFYVLALLIQLFCRQ